MSVESSLVEFIYNIIKLIMIGAYSKGRLYKHCVGTGHCMCVLYFKRTYM